MRTLEIRRHSLRSKGSPHLNQAGVDLARLAGSRMGPFDRVVSSMQPRAFETAIAMGFAVDEQTERLDPLGDGVHQHVEWDAGFAAYADAIQHSDGVRQAGQQLRDLLISIAGSLPESGAALIATHGGLPELCAAACLPDAGVAALGPYIRPCEGIRLEYDAAAGAFVSVRALRVPLAPET